MTQTSEEGRLDLAAVFPQFVPRLTRVLQKREITAEDLADRTGLSLPTIRRILSGSANPTISTLLRVTQEIGLPLEQLLGPETMPDRPEESSAPTLLGVPPVGDPTAYWIYRELCRGVNEDDLARDLFSESYLLPGEEPHAAISRAVLDVLHYHQAWMHADQVPRDHSLERAITERFDLPLCPVLRETIPVRVVDLTDETYRLLRILAVAAVAADVSRQLVQRYRTIGVSDGFASAAWQLFLRRGALSHVELVPLVLNPNVTQIELSANAIIASMMRTHFGYHVGSTIEIDDLQARLREVNHAVVSCGPGTDESNARLPRLVRESSLPYGQVFEELDRLGVAGDLLYHFLREGGEEVPYPHVTGDILGVDKSDLRGGENVPLIYTTPLAELAEICTRGVALLQSHQRDRAAVVRAVLAIEPRPVNFLVITRDLATDLLA